MFLLHQQSDTNQMLKIAARLSLPAQAQALCHRRVLWWGAHRADLCSALEQPLVRLSLACLGEAGGRCLSSAEG